MRRVVAFVSGGMLVLWWPLQYASVLRTRLSQSEGFEVNRILSAFAQLALPVLMLTATGSTAAPTAYFKVGDDLKASCEETAAGEQNASTAEHLLCLGYLQAVVDTDATFAEWSESPRRACIPQGVASSQLRQVFLDWLNERPDYLRFSAASLALTAFSETWPCEIVAKPATPAPVVAAPGPRPAILTRAQEVAAIRYNQSRFSDRKSVLEIQRLVGAGLDGVWGEDTVQRVAQVQQNAGSTVDGMVGPQTLEHIGWQHVATGAQKQ